MYASTPSTSTQEWISLSPEHTSSQGYLTASAFALCTSYPSHKLYIQGSASNQAIYQVRIVLAGIPYLTTLEVQTHERLENKFIASTEIPFFEPSQIMEVEITLQLMFNHQIVDSVSVGTFACMASGIPAVVPALHYGLYYQHQASAPASYESLITPGVYTLTASEGSSSVDYAAQPTPTQYMIPSSIQSADHSPVPYPSSIQHVDPSPMQYTHSAPVQYVDPRAVMGSNWEESNASYFNGGSSSSNTGLLSPLLTPVLPPSILSASTSVSSASSPYSDQSISSMGPQRTTKKSRPAKATASITARKRFSGLHLTHSASHHINHQPVTVAPKIPSPQPSPYSTSYPSPEETHASLPITKPAPKPAKPEKVSDYEPPNTDFVSLTTATSVNDMTKDWTSAEVLEGRRLVRFTVTDRATNGCIKVNMCAISPHEYNDMSLIEDTFSCIARPSGGHVITSVDLIRLAGLLYGDGTENDEKGRLRRHLQRMEPETIGRKDDPEGIFDRISKFEEPRPLSIVKNVKLFDWSRLLDAMEYIVAKRISYTNSG